MAPRVKKSTTSFADDLKRKKAFFKQRFPGFKKKATELSVLCGNEVGFICHGPDNDLHVWPEPQDDPQALPQIIARFNAMSDQKRRNHACGLYDFFPNLMGLSGDELMIHLSNLRSHVLAVRQKKIAVLSKTVLKGSSDEEQKFMKLGTESNLKDMATSEDQIRRNQQSTTRKSKPYLTESLDKELMIYDNATFSNPSLSEDLLGFGGVFDELGYIVCGSSMVSGYDPFMGEATDSLTYQT